ncbi:MAG: TonB-dependent receptor domain-containing protein, partial [Acidobacteriota bacterium]
MNRHSATLTPASLLLTLVMVAPSAQGQVSTFDLTGTILDETGAVLPGTALILVHEESGLTRTATANESGRYAFVGMPTGTYYLEVALPGFATTRYAGLRYYANTKPILNVTLRLREVQESVTVTGEAPLVNTSQSQIGLSVDERQIGELPLETRDYLDLVTLAAGVTDVTKHIPGSTVLGSRSQNINGTYARYTSYQLDGFNNTRDQHGVAKVDLGLDSIEEFRVITNQFSAEYGQSMGGIVSAITKTGGNDFHGSGFAFIRPGELDAADALTGEETSLDRQDVGFTVSGPIRRDSTHFFTSLEYRNEDEDVVVTAPVDHGRYQGVFGVGSNRTRFLGKVSHRFNENHRLTGKMVLNDETIVDGVGGLDIFENRRNNRNDDWAVYGTLISLLGSSVVNEARLGFISEKYESAARPPPEGVALIYPTLGTVGNPNRFQSANEDQWEVADTLSISRGDHGFKMGIDFIRIDTNADLQVFFDGAYQFSPSARFPVDPNDPSTHPFLYLQGFFAPGAPSVLLRHESHIQAFFQDDWQVTPHFTLNLGARWEKETSVPDDDNFSPRIGFNWDASHDGRTSIRGGYGVFYSYVFSAIESFEIFLGPQGFFVAALTPDDPLFPDFPESLPGPNAPPGVIVPPGNKYLNAPEFAPEKRRTPYSQHFTVGLEREIAHALSVAADVTYILGQNLILPLDVNAPSFFDYSSGLTRPATAADATRPFGVPGRPIAPGETEFVTRPFPFSGYRDLYLLDSRGASQYWAVKLNVTRRYLADFMLQGVYTWSRTRNDGDDFRPANSLPLNPSDYEAEWARSATDIPHSLVVNGVWD